MTTKKDMSFFVQSFFSFLSLSLALSTHTRKVRLAAEREKSDETVFSSFLHFRLFFFPFLRPHDKRPHNLQIMENAVVTADPRALATGPGGGQKAACEQQEQQHTWETVKENYKPLKKGRRPEELLPEVAPLGPACTAPPGADEERR